MLYPLSYGSGVSKHASSGCIVAQGWAMVGTTSGSTPAGGQTDRVQSNPSPTDRSRPVPPQLLPRTAEVDGDGTLLIGGCNVLDLAEEFGTPLFVYDEAHLRERCREAMAAFDGRVAYASKAFLCRAMARLVHEEGMTIDVATGGEYHVARAAGVPAASLVMHGNNKSEAELNLAMRDGVGRIVVDSFDELDRIEALVAGGAPSPAVLIRTNPGIEVHTLDEVATGVPDSKFGFPLAAGDAAGALARAAASPAMELMGIHVHIGSQVFSAENFADALAMLGPVRSTMITALVPGLSALGAVVFLGEPLSVALFGGLALVTVGILFGVRAASAGAPVKIASGGHSARGTAGKRSN